MSEQIQTPKDDKPNRLEVLQAIAKNPDFTEQFEQIARIALRSATVRGSLRYWEQHPDVDVLGTGFDPMTTKELIPVLEADANDAVASLVATAESLFYQALQTYFGEE